MPEAEELIIDAARHATVAVRGLWQRHRAPQEVRSEIFLADVKRRLGMLMGVVLGQEVPIRTAQAQVPVSFTRRLFSRSVVTAATNDPLPATDGTAVYLPPALPAPSASAGIGPTDDYCLLGLLQAVRCQRGSATYWDQALPALAMDLYLLAEAVAADHTLRRLLPGWNRALNDLYGRTGANLRQRPPRTALESEVARLYGTLLAASREGPPLTPDPAAALDWAQAQATLLGRRYPRERYRPWLGDLVVGRLLPPEAAPSLARPGTTPPEEPADAKPQHKAALSRRPRARSANDEDDPSPGAWMVQTSEPQPHAEDPLGLNRPEDKEAEDDLAGAAESLAELEEARLVHTPGWPREVFYSADPPPRLAREGSSGALPQGFSYPEWDCRSNAYVENAVHLKAREGLPGRAAWVTATLARHEAMLAEMRRRLDAIRPQRSVLKRQMEGDEIDLDAWVGEYGERQAGVTASGDFYQCRRPAPRRLGLVLVIDASASTDGWISGSTRIIDVEKEAALVAASALDAARADFAVLAFSGEGPRGVDLREIKAFDSPWDNHAQRRLAGLEPDRYTRLGAPLRHASALLAARPVDHRLLLLFSDGKPSDCDHYASQYGIEDARQALVEARLQQITPYCLTVDREGSDYLPRLFGQGHYTIVQHPQQLPLAFVEWMRQAARRCRL